MTLCLKGCRVQILFLFTSWPHRLLFSTLSLLLDKIALFMHYANINDMIPEQQMTTKAQSLLRYCWNGSVMPAHTGIRGESRQVVVWLDYLSLL